MCFESRIPSLISIADVSRAHFFADAVRDVYVRLPDEDPKAKQPGVSGKLRKTMYGSLDAAQRWREHYAQVWETGGFSRGAASPCHFFHKDLETYILVHGDCTEFAARCIRVEQSGNSGPGPSQSRTVSFLVGEPKASQISELAKWHDLPEEVREEDDLLTGEELKLFQSVAARFDGKQVTLDKFFGNYLTKSPLRLRGRPETKCRSDSDSRAWLN